MKQLGSCIVNLIGLVSGFITIVIGYDEFCEKLGIFNIPAWINTTLYILLIVIFVLLLIYKAIIFVNWATKGTRKRMGTHEIPCSLYYMLRYKYKMNCVTILAEMHNQLYHRYYILKQQIDNDEYINEKSKQQAIANFLGYVQNSIVNVFGLRLTISVKLLSADTNGNYFLIPYAHYKNNQNTNSHTERNYNYIYLIEKENSDDMKIYTCRAKEYNRNEGSLQYKVNSIFTFLLNKDYTYWMSNDLLVDYSKDVFYTSSDNYEKHYKSMAVFKLIPPENNKASKGIIVFDSLDTNKFSESECRLFMGYIAHLIYELV